MSKTAIARLRSVAVLAGKLLGTNGEWFAATFAAYERGAPMGMTLDAAFGLVPGAGGELWWRSEIRERRDGHIRDLADKLCPHGSIGNRKTAVRAELRRYDRRWQSADRYRDMAPDAYCADPVYTLLFEIFRTDRDLRQATASPAVVPIGRTALRAILEGRTTAGTRAARKRAPAADRRTETILAARRRATRPGASRKPAIQKANRLR